jgi:hypothetical protein
VRFFLDNCLSPRYAQSLDILSQRDGYRVVHLQHKFPRDVKDPDWLRALGEEGGWVVISGDTRIVRNAELKREWSKACLTTFFLSAGWGNASYWSQIGLLVRWWPSILEKARLVELGSGFEVPFRMSGRLKPLFRPL